MFDRKNLRLSSYDYSSPGMYYVTICTQGREHYFGNVKNGVVGLSDYGSIAHQYWNEILMHFKNVSVDKFITMPNHVHGIIVIHDVGVRFIAPCESNTPREPGMFDDAGFVGCKNPMGSGSLGEIVRWFKGRSTYECNKINVCYERGDRGEREGVMNHAPTDTFNMKIWQRNYYDHIIRDDEDLNRIRQYIINNPMNWDFDDLNG